MTNEEWLYARDGLVREIVHLGFPAELGQKIAKILGSPGAIERMTMYLQYSGVQSAEMIVDEALAIRSEIDTWRAKKEAQESNAAYNMLLWHGLDDGEE
jgi:hypothetical protein